MKVLSILALFLVLSVSMVMVGRVWSLPFDVEPPKCYFCCDVNFDGRVDIKDVFIVARSFGSTWDMPRWNPAADINGDGRVDLLDIVLVIRCVFFG